MKTYFLLTFRLRRTSEWTWKGSIIFVTRSRDAVYFYTRVQNGRFAHCECENAARSHFYMINEKLLEVNIFSF